MAFAFSSSLFCFLGKFSKALFRERREEEYIPFLLHGFYSLPV